MGERPNVIIPDPGAGQRDFVREFRPWWQQAEEKWYGKWIPQNEKYDPIYREWYKSQWSMRGARKREGIWLTISWLFYAAMFVFPVIGFIDVSVRLNFVPLLILVPGMWLLNRKIKADSMW